MINFKACFYILSELCRYIDIVFTKIITKPEIYKTNNRRVSTRGKTKAIFFLCPMITVVVKFNAPSINIALSLKLNSITVSKYIVLSS